MDDSSVSIWAIAVIGGPIVLGAALAYAVLRMRLRRRRAAAASQRPVARSEENRRS
jgi:hypothetical protein